jgi:hypothetical protein
MPIGAGRLPKIVRDAQMMHVCQHGYDASKGEVHLVLRGGRHRSLSCHASDAPVTMQNHDEKYLDMF